jgi:hypothetical protein
MDKTPSQACLEPGRPSGEYLLEFDASTRWGSSEHFFHFMWGYLLPALLEIASIEESTDLKKSRNRYLFQSCGPIIDKLIIEMLSLYEWDCEIVTKGPMRRAIRRLLATLGLCSRIVVPRWDVELRDADAAGELRPQLRTSIQAVREHTLRRIERSPTGSASDSYSGSYLILKRSAQPEFYKRGGKAESPGYGVARRSLTGIEEAAQELRKRNLSVEVYEPGKSALVEQIRVFRSCRGIVGIRGAEFANLIWMRPKSKVVLVQPSFMNDVRVQKTIAVNLDLEYREIVANNGKYPTLDGDAVYECLVR